MVMIWFLIGVSLFGATRVPSTEELKEYVAQVYRADYLKLDEAGQTKIKQEYKQRIELSEKIIATGLKNDPDFSYKYMFLRQNMAIDLWSKKILESVKPTEEELKKLYEKQKDLKVSTRYQLSDIIVNDEKTADDLIKKLEMKEKPKQKELFESLVISHSQNKTNKDKKGDMGWGDMTNIPKNIFDIIKNKPEGSFIKNPVSLAQWEIIYIVKIVPEHKASFEESKVHLINILKQNAIAQEKEKLTPSTPSKTSAKH